MSVAPFVVGLIAGGARYGVVKYQLHEREDVVFYSLDQIKESFHGGAKVAALERCVLRSSLTLFLSQKLQDERYVPLRSREHEYYTYARESWNAKVLAFRDGVYGFFSPK
jgi:hypothetical protein